MIPGPGDVKAQRLGAIQDSYFSELGLVGPPSVGGSKNATFRVREKVIGCPLVESWSFLWLACQVNQRNVLLYFLLYFLFYFPFRFPFYFRALPYRPPHIHVWGPIFGESEGARSGGGFSAGAAAAPRRPHPKHLQCRKLA